ncbi:MAG: hypothetical protein ABG776_10950 [Cyanobacteria bacterium J06555_13]
MPKISECDRCQYFVNSPYMVCGVNPGGPEGNTCEDFSPSAKADATTQRTPLGGGYYVGDWIPAPFPTPTTAEQLALLDSHPQFTSRCPNCEMPIVEAVAGRWSCGHCEWEETEAIAT